MLRLSAVIDKCRYGYSLKALRMRCGISQADLAALCCRSPSEISRWERGFTLPGIDVLMPLAKALHVSPVDLLPEPDVVEMVHNQVHNLWNGVDNQT